MSIGLLGSVAMPWRTSWTWRFELLLVINLCVLCSCGHFFYKSCRHYRLQSVECCNLVWTEIRTPVLGVIENYYPFSETNVTSLSEKKVFLYLGNLRLFSQKERTNIFQFPLIPLARGCEIRWKAHSILCRLSKYNSAFCVNKGQQRYLYAIHPPPSVILLLFFTPKFQCFWRRSLLDVMCRKSFFLSNFKLLQWTFTKYPPKTREHPPLEGQPSQKKSPPFPIVVLTLVGNIDSY